MAEKYTKRPYFGQDGILSIQVPGSTEYQEIGIVQNWKVTVEAETHDLYGIGDIWRQGAARSNAKVTVNIEYCALEDEIMHSIVPYIINPKFVPDSESPQTSVSTKDIGANTTSLARFKLQGVFTGEDGVHQKTITAGDVYFANFPWEASTGDWIKFNLEGTGSSFSIAEGTV